MKKLLYLVGISLAIICSSMCISGIHNSSNALLTVLDQNCVFMISPTHVFHNSVGTFIYDKFDNSIKEISPQNEIIVIDTINDVTDVCAIETDLYFLTKTNVIKLDLVTKTQTEIYSDTLPSCNSIKVNRINNQTILSLYSTNSSANTQSNVVVHYAILNDDGPVILSTISFNNNEIIQLSEINDLDFIYVSAQTYLVIATNTSLTACAVSFDNNEPINSYVSLTIVEGTSPITSINTTVDAQDSKSYIVASTTFKTNIYEVNKGSQSISVQNINTISHIYQASEFNVVFASVSNDTLYLLSDNSFYSINTSADSEDSFQKFDNPTLSLTYSSASNFKYYKTVTDCTLFTSPDKATTTIIPANSFVVEIAEIVINNEYTLKDYKYVLFANTNNVNVLSDNAISKNLYGYLKCSDSDVELIEDSSENVEIVKVFPQTNLYSLPSINADEINTYKKISGNLPVEILHMFTTYTTTNNNVLIKYALVKIEDQVGFIDISRIQSSDIRVLLVIPNAKLTSDTTVWELSDSNSSVVHNLQKGQKVKILLNRDSNGFVKICYNDASGNYFEGYIKASTVKANYWSTLQIIGCVLVVLNSIFLVILITTKRRIAQKS